MKRSLCAAIFTFSLSLGGCSALEYRNGTEITQAKLESFKKGVSRREDVSAALGHPPQKAEIMGKEVWTYSFDIVPGLPFQKAKSENTVFEFDKQGILVDAYKSNVTGGFGGSH